MYEENLALNNLQSLICNKINETKFYTFNIYVGKGFGIK